MNIIIDEPPMIDAIAERFPRCLTTPTLFAYGATIYNPKAIRVTDALLAHEAIHGQRQLSVGVEAWWFQYLEDDEFRLEEEALAHGAEYLVMVEGAGRRVRRRIEITLADKLRDGLYRWPGPVKRGMARRLILGAAKVHIEARDNAQLVEVHPEDFEP